MPRRATAAPAPAPPKSPSPITPLPVFHATSPGDVLWGRLTPETPGVLPVQLVGPIAESAFETLPGESYDVPEGDVPSWDDAPSSGGLSAIWGGGALAPDPSWSPIEHEAFNHLPPHLRSAPPTWKELRGPRSPPNPAKAASGAECASCRRGLANPPAWRACTTCHRPFCGECAFRSRRNLGGGRCMDCRTYPEIEEARFVS
jgi:hypothetical protein